MHKDVRTITFLSLALSVAGCSPKDGAYTGALITDTYEVLPVGLRVDKCSAEEHCVYFEYDGKELRRLTYFNNGSIRDGSGGGGNYGPASMTISHEQEWEVWSFLDASGEPFGMEAIVRIKRGPDGRPTSLFLYDGDEEPASLYQPYQTEYAWESKSRKAIVESYDDEGQPFEIHSNAYKRHLTLDDRNRTIAVAYLDADNDPVADTEGIAGESILYDRFNRVVEYKEISESGHPIASEKRVLWRFRYVDNCLVETQLVGGSGRVLETDRVECDSFGNVIRKEKYGPDGLLVRDGPSVMILSRDDVGRIASKRFFDHDRKPTYSENGAHEYRYVYDEYGRRAERRCFDGNGDPTTENIQMYYFGRTETIAAHRAVRTYKGDAKNYDEVQFYSIDGQLERVYSIDYGDSFEL